MPLPILLFFCGAGRFLFQSIGFACAFNGLSIVSQSILCPDGAIFRKPFHPLNSHLSSSQTFPKSPERWRCWKVITLSNRVTKLLSHRLLETSELISTSLHHLINLPSQSKLKSLPTLGTLNFRHFSHSTPSISSKNLSSIPAFVS